MEIYYSKNLLRYILMKKYVNGVTLQLEGYNTTSRYLILSTANFSNSNTLTFLVVGQWVTIGNLY